MMHFVSVLVAATTLATLAHFADARGHVKIHLSVPTLVQCEVATFTWEGGKPPFKLWAEPDMLKPDVGSTIADNSSDFSADWLVDAPAGSRVRLKIVDGGGRWSKTYAEVHLGRDAACLNPGYPEPTAPPREAPEEPLQWMSPTVAFAVVALVALGAAAWFMVRKRRAQANGRGDYVRVSQGTDAEFTGGLQLTQVGPPVTPTFTIEDDDDAQEEHDRLLQPRGRDS